MKTPHLLRPCLTSVCALSALSASCSLPHPGGRAVKVAPSEVVVALSAYSDLAPTQWRGITNLFYQPIVGATRDSVRTLASWTDADLDDVISSPSVRRVPILRFRASGDTAFRFAIDTVGNLDFTGAPMLSFTRQGKVLVASIDLTIRSASGSWRRVPYQILRSNDGYTYARIAEYRTGLFVINGDSFAVRVRNSTRGHPFFGVNTGTVFLVDMNRDGQFSETAALTVDGRPVAAEQVIASTPFELSGQFYELSAIDSSGTTLRIRRSHREFAVAVNRRAPELKAKVISGGEFVLSRQVGKLVLISFWATDCPHSERIRVAANELVTRYGTSFTWMAMAKDTSRKTIEKHLTDHPINGVVALPDSSAWTTYNPMDATPVFVIVDRRGIVRFRAEGAAALSAVSAKLDELYAGR